MIAPRTEEDVRAELIAVDKNPPTPPLRELIQHLQDLRMWPCAQILEYRKVMTATEVAALADGVDIVPNPYADKIVAPMYYYLKGKANGGAMASDAGNPMPAYEGDEPPAATDFEDAFTGEVFISAPSTQVGEAVADLIGKALQLISPTASVVPGGALTIEILDGGSDYEAGQLLVIDDGNEDAVVRVEAVDEDGVITSLSIRDSGTGYVPEEDVNLTYDGSGGTGDGLGATINILTTDPSVNTMTVEVITLYKFI